MGSRMTRFGAFDDLDLTGMDKGQLYSIPTALAMTLTCRFEWMQLLNRACSTGRAVACSGIA